MLVNALRSIKLVAQGVPKFVKTFLADNYPGGSDSYPAWATDALKTVGIIT